LGLASFELQIDGTTAFDDDNGVLLGLGVLDAPTTLSANTSFADVLGGGVQAGDTISISGTNNAGAQVSGSFTISSSGLKIQNLLNTVEQTFGNGVTASVDSSGRIVVADDQSGSSSLNLSLLANNEGGGNFDLGALTETTQGIDARSAELQAGQNASFRINGISLSRSTNTVTDAVQGITLDLKEAEVGKLVDVTVTKDDTTELRQNIGTFVTEFNSVADLINQQFVVNEDTQRAGPLSGDSTLIGLQTRLRSLVSSEIGGLAEGFNALVLIGVSFDRSGHLNIDDDTLNNALNNNLEDVRKLFVAQGNTADDKVEFISASNKTRSGDYEVNIISAPGKASLISTVELTGGLDADQTLTITDKATGIPAIIELQAGDSLDQIVSQINTEMASDVAEVRRGSIANSTDGTAAIGSGTAFADIFGAGVQDGDTIRINGTTHEGRNTTNTFLIDDAGGKTVGDLLSEIRSTFNGAVSASVDSEGRIVITDNQVGPSSLTVTLLEENEGSGSLNLGSIDVIQEGRFNHELTATNRDGKLFLEHGGFGSRNGFSISQSLDQLGLGEGDYEGGDVEGTINGEETDGFGRILSGKIGSETVEGLSLRVTLTGEELETTGSERGSLNLIYGVARQLSDALSFITDKFDGTLKHRGDAITDTITDMDDQIASMERRIELMRTNLVRKFASLEGSLATLQSEGNFLTSQLATLAR
jgi:flagellar hook-associated protein 2